MPWDTKPKVVSLFSFLEEENHGTERLGTYERSHSMCYRIRKQTCEQSDAGVHAVSHSTVCCPSAVILLISSAGFVLQTGPLFTGLSLHLKQGEIYPHVHAHSHTQTHKNTLFLWKLFPWQALFNELLPKHNSQELGKQEAHLKS